jgi:hypothetical protein
MNIDLWKNIDFVKVEASFYSNANLKLIETYSHAELKKLCSQYRYFISYFLDDLSHLVSRLPDSKLKTVLEGIYFEEMGEGDQSRNHLALYDQFLISIDADIEDCSTFTLELMEKLSRLTKTGSMSYAVGLRGMGAECICGIYFKVMNQFLFSNPYIIENIDKINKDFWDIHAGEDDESHRFEVRKAIGEFIEKDNGNSTQLWEGYLVGKQVWETFWDHQFR